MATTTSPQLGSSKAVVPFDKSVSVAPSNKLNFGLNQSDSKSSLFEELLSLPLFDSKLPEDIPRQSESRVQKSSTGNASPYASDEIRDEKSEEQDPSTEASPYPTVSQVLTNLVQAPIANDSNQGLRQDNQSTPTQYKNAKNDQPVADSVAPPRKGKLEGGDLVNPKSYPTNDAKSRKLPDEKSSIATGDLKANVIPANSANTPRDAELTSTTDTEAVPVAKSITGTTSPDNVKSKAESNKSLSTSEEDQAVTIESLAPSTQETNVPLEQPPETKLQGVGSQENEQEAAKRAEPESTRRSARLSEVRRELRFGENQENANDSTDTSSNFSENSSNKDALQATPTTAGTLQQNLSDDIATGLEVGIDVSLLSGLPVTSTIPTTITPSITEAIAASSLALNEGTVATATSSHVVGGSSPTIGSVTATPGTVTSSLFSNTSSSSSIATPGSPGPTKYQEQRVLHRALKGIEQAQDAAEPIRVRLHPPELGSLQVTVRVERSEVTAAIEVESSAAQHVLLDNLPKLQASLKEQGISIADFRVDIVAPGEFSSSTSNGFSQPQGQFRDGTWSAPKSRYTEIAKNRINEPLVANGTSSASSAAAWTRRDGNLDVNV